MDLRRQDYESTYSIGSGAYGMVKAGYMRQTGEQIVVKEGAVKYLEKEYHIMQQLVDVPHIVQLKGRCLLSQAPDPRLSLMHIVMERAQRSLDSLLKEAPYRRGLAPVDLIQLISHLGRGFNELVTRKIAHRDIKPQNILVFGSGADPPHSKFTFKLCDFGFSRLAEEGEELHTIAGTPGFIHPALYQEYAEHPGRLQMNTPYTAERCDLWSIGATIYNSATASMAFPVYKDVKDNVELFGKRPKGTICAMANRARGFQYYTQIRNDSYPRWLRLALSHMISVLFDSPRYKDLFSLCTALEQVNPKNVVHLPSLTPTTHCSLDMKPFQRDTRPLHTLFGIPPTSRISVITSTDIYSEEVFVNSLRSLRGDTFIVYSELGEGKGSEVVDAPPLPPTSDYPSLVQELFMLKASCDSSIDGWLSSHNTIMSYAKALSSRQSEVESWVRAVERHAELTSTLATLATAVSSRPRGEMLTALGNHQEEISSTKSQLSEQKKRMEEVTGWLKEWRPLDERLVSNLEESMSQLRTGDEKEGRAEWAKTLRNVLSDRLKQLQADCRERIRREGGAMQVCRALVEMSDGVATAMANLKSVVGLLDAVLNPAQREMKEFMEMVTNEPESVIRRNLTNYSRVTPMLRESTKRQKEMLESLQKQVEELSIQLRVGRDGDAAVAT